MNYFFSLVLWTHTKIREKYFGKKTKEREEVLIKVKLYYDCIFCLWQKLERTLKQFLRAKQNIKKERSNKKWKVLMKNSCLRWSVWCNNCKKNQFIKKKCIKTQNELLTEKKEKINKISMN